MYKKMTSDGEFIFVLYKIFEEFLEKYEITEDYLLNYVEVTFMMLKKDNFRFNFNFIKS